MAIHIQRQTAPDLEIEWQFDADEFGPVEQWLNDRVPDTVSIAAGEQNLIAGSGLDNIQRPNIPADMWKRHDW